MFGISAFGIDGFGTLGGIQQAAVALAIADASHGHVADNVGLSTASSISLSVAESTHAHTADNIALATQQLLAIADALHAHAADNEVLDTSSAVWLTVQEALHAHAADGLGLSLQTWLAVADAVQAHYADATVLSVPTGGFTGSLSDDDIARIAAAVLAALNATTGARTLGEHLQIQTAVLAGEETGAGTTHITFTDGAVVVEADVPLPGAVGNRTNVAVAGV